MLDSDWAVQIMPGQTFGVRFVKCGGQAMHNLPRDLRPGSRCRECRATVREIIGGSFNGQHDTR